MPPLGNTRSRAERRRKALAKPTPRALESSTIHPPSEASKGFLRIRHRVSPEDRGVDADDLRDSNISPLRLHQTTLPAAVGRPLEPFYGTLALLSRTLLMYGGIAGVSGRSRGTQSRPVLVNTPEGCLKLLGRKGRPPLLQPRTSLAGIGLPGVFGLRKERRDNIRLRVSIVRHMRAGRQLRALDCQAGRRALAERIVCPASYRQQRKRKRGGDEPYN